MLGGVLCTNRGELTNRWRSFVSRNLPLRTGGLAFHSFINHPKEIPTDLHFRRPKLLKDLERAQGLGRRLFQPTLSIPNCGLQQHHATQFVSAFSGVQLGFFDVCLYVFEITAIKKQIRQ